MLHPLVSIVIPCHNDGELLLEALASAQAQTLPGCEVIIANDHSTAPRTLDILRRLGEEGKKIVNVPDGHAGLPAARNCAIRESRGKYILPLDADNKLAPQYAQQASDVLARHADVALCYGRAEFFGLKEGPWNLEAYSYPKLLCSNMIDSCAMFRRTDFDRLGGYDERLRLGYEDWAFWIKLLEGGGRVVRLDEVLFYYRVREASLSANIRKRRLKALFAVLSSCRWQYLRHFPLYAVMQCARIVQKMCKACCLK